jgi:uncharacterized lipoprotein YajG
MRVGIVFTALTLAFLTGCDAPQTAQGDAPKPNVARQYSTTGSRLGSGKQETTPDVQTMSAEAYQNAMRGAVRGTVSTP